MIFNKVIERISILKNRCRSSECSIIGVLFRMLMFRLVYKKHFNFSESENKEYKKYKIPQK
ncbi:unnamed protein product [Klebsiella pneumoniae]|nr:unnamed protein product [Klebsiella pneumoniae]